MSFLGKVIRVPWRKQIKFPWKGKPRRTGKTETDPEEGYLSSLRKAIIVSSLQKAVQS